MEPQAIARPLVAVAVSGGVDSLAALLLLRLAGYRLLALHGLFLPEVKIPPLGLRDVCEALRIPLHVIDVRAVFRQAVLFPFVRGYAVGRTPNPCALCNRDVKLGVLLHAASALGADHLATGHYARLVRGPEGEDALPLLATAADSAKDQSYFLSLVPRRRLARVLFPLHGRSKAENRALVAASGLRVPLSSESQDVCFASSPDIRKTDQACTYTEFLERSWRNFALTPSGAGTVFLREIDGTLSAIARHKGLWRYTEGQRKGLGIAWREPLYVLAKDRRSNALIVGPKALLGIRHCVTGPATVSLACEYWPAQVFVRLRYRQRPAPAKVSLERGRLHMTLDEPQFPTAPGQIAAVYAADGRVLAAGVVETMA